MKPPPMKILCVRHWLCHVLSALHSLFFLWRCTRQKFVYHYNATTTAQHHYQTRQPKFILRQALSKHAIILPCEFTSN